MREIIFRGKRLDNGEWVEGNFVKGCIDDFAYIVEFGNKDLCRNYVEVIPETVGQYTGLIDKNGKKIFEGDIFSRLDSAMDGIPRIVRWDEEHMEFKCPLVKKHWAFGKSNCSLWLMKYEDIEVIGNIHDNPELLKGDPHDRP